MKNKEKDAEKTKDKEIEKIKPEKEKEEASDKFPKLEKPDKHEKDKPEKIEKEKPEKDKDEASEKHFKIEKPDKREKDKPEKAEKDKHEKEKHEKEKHEKQEKDKPEKDKHEKSEFDKTAPIEKSAFPEKTAGLEKPSEAPGKTSEAGGIQQAATTSPAIEARLARLEAAIATPKSVEKATEGKQLEKKIETKEIKEAKVEKVEKQETKEHPKIEKVEKFEKVEHKDKIEKFEKVEHKDKFEKFEKVEPKELHPEKIPLKLEPKEFQPEKIPFEGGKFNETGPGPVETGALVAEQIDTSGTVEERLARLEQAVFKMSHFIGVDLRPDLSAGALKREADLQEPAAPPAQGKDQPPPAGGKEGKKP